MPNTLGLYLHIPFCVQKCRYCDFCSAPANAATRAAYVQALCRQLVSLAPRARGRTVDTVYLGGGTPTMLDGADFSRILDTVRAHYTLTPCAEITSECNPVTGSERLFDAMLTAGVNRLSIGVQSVHARELSLLGRLHTYPDFLTTLADARRAGFRNVSADVMFGIPSQTPATFRETLEALCEQPLTHLSSYGLRIEAGTPFWYERDTLPLPSEDEEAKMADLVATLLPSHGFARYEISNYARDGMESRHNLRYWLGEEYLGFGVAAHSFFEGVRFASAQSVTAYLAATDFDALVTEQHVLTPHEAREEYTMLRMRLAHGIDKEDFARRFGLSFREAYGDYAHLVEGGFLIDTPSRVAFTPRGFEVSNAILSEWLDFGGQA